MNRVSKKKRQTRGSFRKLGKKNCSVKFLTNKLTIVTFHEELTFIVVNILMLLAFLSHL